MQLLSLLRGHVSASAQDTGSAKTPTSTTSAASATASALCGHTSPVRGQTLSCLLADQPKTRRLVVATALNHLFEKSFFSICQLDSLLKIVDGTNKSEAYKLLHALHCIDYTSMPKELKDSLPQLVNEALTAHTNPQPLPATEIAMKNIQL
jgi:hypothetical protein